jgi:CHAD domain-containing protein
VTEQSVHAEIQKTEKQSRHAFDKARKTRLADDFHELRKSVKRQQNQARLMDPARVDELKKLASLLGDHHNLAVLLSSLENTSARFRAIVRRQMKGLEANILTAELPLISRVF